MKKKSIIIYVLCFLLGICACGIVFYLNPKELIKTIKEENVTITDNGISKSVKKVNTSVVVVQAYSTNDVLISTGTGFVYSKADDKSYIMTNHHVIENAATLKITYSDDSETTAKIVGSDEYADIAVLSVDTNTILSVIELGDSKKVEIGDTVFTIGSPMGIDYRGTATRGILSNKDRLVYVDDFIMNVMQTDAAINPGNSGGPLCNINGEVIGITSMKIVQDTIEGIGFAIPIEDALIYSNDIIKNGKVLRPYIGVNMINASNTFQLYRSGIRLDDSISSGVVIANVFDNSEAKKAGLNIGDVIIKVNDYKISDIAEFRYRLYSFNVGDQISLTIIRNSKEEVVKVNLGSSS